jgi:hypothetical protein
MPGLEATNLTNFNASDTFYGILHAGGQNMPPSGQPQIYDGFGTPTALRLGSNCNGATICGPLSATSLSLDTPILSSTLPSVPNVEGTYTGYLTSFSVTNKGIVTGVGATSTIPLPYRARAAVNLNIPYNKTANQGSDFTIVGNNIQTITWVKTGLYRAFFAVSMPDTNYIPFVQNVVSTLSGEYPANTVVAGENSMIVGFKGLDFFEFACWSDEADDPENMQGCGILVV